MKALTFIQKISLVIVLIFATTTQNFAQTMLPELVVTASNYKYLNAVSPEEAAVPVNLLQQYAAAYDIKGVGFYEDVYDNYFVSFYIPEGKILAAYDKDGKLLRTAERYKDIGVPGHIRQAVAKKYPEWKIAKDVYLVNYFAQGGGVTEKLYKIVLENGDKRMRIKINDQDEFL